MKKKISTAVIATTLCLAPLISQAETTQEPKKYLGGSLNFLSYEEPGLEADLIAGTGRFGAFFNKYLAGELRLGIGLAGDDVDISGTTVDLDLNYIFGAYLRAGLPINDKVFPYALLGYSRGELEVSAGGLSINEAESDISFGFGVDININDPLTINVEYANLLDKDGVEVSGFSLGAVVNF
jgi:opacity protein-like surface antigen